MSNINALLANVDHIVGYEFAKDATRGDMPITRSYFVLHPADIGKPDKVKAYVTNLIRQDRFPADSIGDPGPGSPIGKGNSTMSIKVLDGDNLYLVRLANGSDNPFYDTQAKWGPTTKPVSMIPETIHGDDPSPIKHLCIVHVENGQLRFTPGEHMPPKLTDIDDCAWLAFRCDIADMRKLWKKIGFNPEKQFVFPFRFNMFDRVYGTPVWNVADHSHRNNDRAHDVHKEDQGDHFETHGGIHPDWLARTLTHGGIHPDNLIRIWTHGGIYPRRTLTHGGIHPDSMIDYLYGGP